LSPEMIQAAKTGAEIGVGIDHDAYRYSIDTLAAPNRESLLDDLN
jgi:hypothetical protein